MYLLLLRQVSSSSLSSEAGGCHASLEKPPELAPEPLRVREEDLVAGRDRARKVAGVCGQLIEMRSMGANT